MSEPFGRIPSEAEERTQLRVVTLEAERDYWKEKADEYRRELQNIPAAIEEHGNWKYRGSDGHLITLVKKGVNDGDKPPSTR